MEPISRDEQIVTFTIKSRTNVCVSTFSNGKRNFMYFPYLDPWFWMGKTHGSYAYQAHNKRRMDQLISTLGLPYRYNKGRFAISHLLIQQDNPKVVDSGQPQTHTVLPGYLDIMTDTDGVINENHPIMEKEDGGYVKDWTALSNQASQDGLNYICQTADPKKNVKNPQPADDDSIWETAGKIDELTPGEKWEHKVNFGNWHGHWMNPAKYVWGNGTEGTYLLYNDFVMEGPNNKNAIDQGTYLKDIKNRQYGGQGVLFGQSKVTHPMIIIAGPRMKDSTGKNMNQRATFHLEREIEISVKMYESWDADSFQRMVGKNQITPPRTDTLLSTIGTGTDAQAGYYRAPYRHFH